MCAMRTRKCPCSLIVRCRRKKFTYSELILRRKVPTPPTVVWKISEFNLHFSLDLTSGLSFFQEGTWLLVYYLDGNEHEPSGS